MGQGDCGQKSWTECTRFSERGGNDEAFRGTGSKLSKPPSLTLVGSLGRALELYLETRSVTKTIRMLDLQVSRAGFYKWIKKAHAPVREVKNKLKERPKDERTEERAGSASF